MTHRTFLKSTFEGILQLTIHGAKDLKAVNVRVEFSQHVCVCVALSRRLCRMAAGQLTA